MGREYHLAREQLELPPGATFSGKTLELVKKTGRGLLAPAVPHRASRAHARDRRLGDLE